MNFIFKELFKSLLANMKFVILAIIAFYGWSLWSENQKLHKELIGQKEKYEQITKYVAKLEIQYKKQSDLLNKKEKEWKEVLKEKNEKIKLLSDVTYTIGKHISRQSKSDYYYQTPRKTRNFVLNELKIDGDDSPPIGYILIKNDGRVYKRTYKFEIEVKNLQTFDEKTGKVKVYSKAFLVLKEKSPLAKRIKGYKNWQNIKYPVKISGGVVLVDPTAGTQYLKDRFHLWSPHVNANIFLLNDGSLSPGFDISFMGYGKTQNDLKYKFLGLGLFVKDKKLGLSFTPVSKRIFPKYLTNSYLGVNINHDGDKMYFGLGLNLSL